MKVIASSSKTKSQEKLKEKPAAITLTAIPVIEKKEMMRVLHAEQALSDRFMSYVLSRNIRIEEDLGAHRAPARFTEHENSPMSA